MRARRGAEEEILERTKKRTFSPYYRLHSRAEPVEALSSHKYRQEIGGYSKPSGDWSPPADSAR